jgi:hypothetical protein
VGGRSSGDSGVQGTRLIRDPASSVCRMPPCSGHACESGYALGDGRMNRCQADVLQERLEYASCVGKKTYFSQREADDKAALSSAASGEELIAYQCPFCLLFHMGHRKNKKRLEAEQKLKPYKFESGKRRAM